MSRNPAGRKTPSVLTKANKADRNRRIAIQVGVAAVLVGLVAAIGISIALKNSDDDGTGPVPSIAAPSNAAGVTGTVTDSGAVRIGKPEAKVTVRVVADLQCPACKAFEAANEQTLSQAVNSGTAAVEYNIISFLDKASTNQYSSRAANASYCVAQADPSKYQTWIATMFERQPAEGGAGLTDDQLIEIAKSVGYTDEVASCITDKTYAKFVTSTTQQAFDSGVDSTPTVYVNNEKINPANLAQAITAASGQ
ncbi:DsbA family protein [Nocardia takedensis]|uniref:DsbA family protein n=1 Tax=Nocardia takedensis TaxID=259390 RepID=UPI0003021368|nr:thioredoxin domain-containing protein [Nocardia takedensis]